jgi:hypothetical protein
LVVGCWSARAFAEQGEFDDARPATVRANSETTLRLFQRALLPGPNGALVETDTVAPAYEYVSLSARDIDALGQVDGLELEFWGWASLNLVQTEQSPFDGDVGAANATQHVGPAWVRLGRQLVAGGAARYARFDGLSAGMSFGSYGAHHGSVDAYGGFTVLPRWDATPGYQQLGALQDSALRDPSVLEPVSRGAYALGGVRARYGYKSALDLGLSFHEQREDGELGRRNLGASLHVTPLEQLDGNVDLVLDLDSLALADARSWVDWTYDDSLDASLEFLHTQPDLLLSRQSVLSVFATDSIDELGVTVGYTPLRHIKLAPYGYVEAFPEDEFGARAGVRATVFVDYSKRTRLVLGYGRVVLQGEGYHALQASLSHRLSAPVTLFAESYFYSYDRRIQGHRGSVVYAGNCQWQVARRVELLWGASLASTPYAARDAQTLLRLRVSEVLP